MSILAGVLVSGLTLGTTVLPPADATCTVGLLTDADKTPFSFVMQDGQIDRMPCSDALVVAFRINFDHNQDVGGIAAVKAVVLP